MKRGLGVCRETFQREGERTSERNDNISIDNLISPFAFLVHIA